MQYCIYLRKSRADMEAEARGEGETLARHEHALLNLAKQKNLSITAIYKEIVSGETIAARPVMQQLLSEVEQGGWAGVLVMEIERLVRGDTIDQGIVAQTFKYSNTMIITPEKTYDPANEYDEEYFEFGLFMSRREYKTINRRMQRGRAASVAEGKYVGSKPPFGYVRKKLEKQKGFTLVPDPQQAEIVRLIFDLYVNGENGQCIGVPRIARRLKALGINTVDGDNWTPATIRGILRNPVYIGKIRWNARPRIKTVVNGQIKAARPRAASASWTLVNGLHEPIIEQSVWEEAQKNISQNTISPHSGNKELKNPLAGIVVCGGCGRKMVRRPYNGLYPETLLCRMPECENISSQLQYVEDGILEHLTAWLNQYKLNWDGGKAYAPPKFGLERKKDAMIAHVKDLTVLTRQLSAAHDLLEQGVYNNDTFGERSNSLSQRIREIQDNISFLADEISRETLREQNRRDLIPKVERVLKLYRSAQSPAAKNALLKSVLKKVVYTKTVRGRRHGSLNDFELVLYPKLPKLHADY